MRIAFLFFLICAFHFASAQSIEVSVQNGHSGAVLVVAPSPSGEVIATAGKDKTVRIWEREKARELRVLAGHASSVLSLAFDAKGEFLASADAGGMIKIWNYRTGEALHSWKAHEEAIVRLSFNARGDVLLSSGRDSKLTTWDWKQEKPLHSFKVDGGQKGVKSVFSPDDKKIAAAGDNGFIYLFSLDSPAKMDTLRELNYSFCGGCYAEAIFSKDSKWLATVSDRGPLVRWNAGDLSGKKILAEKVEDYHNMDVNDKGDRLLISYETKVDVYDLGKGELVQSIPQKDKKINHAAFSADGKEIVVATDANEVFSWSGNEVANTYKGKLNDPIPGDLNLDPNSYWESYPYRLAMLKNKYLLSPNGKWAVRGRSGNKVVVWDIREGKPYRMLSGHEKAVISCAFSPDGEKLISGDAEGRVILWDLATGDSLAVTRAHINMVLCFAFSKDGKLVASGGYDGYLRVMDASNLQTARRINFSGRNDYLDSPFSMTFSPNDLYLVVGSLGKEFKMIEIDTGNEYKSFVGHTDVVSRAVTTDANSLGSAAWDGMVKFWDFRSAYQEWKVKASDLPVHDLLFIRDKSFLITGGADREIKIWDLATRELKATLKGHKSQVVSLNYLPGENVLISSTDNGEVKYWNLDNFENTVTQYFTGPEDWVIVDRNGYFNATRGAADAVVFVNGLRSYQPGQFFEKFYNPSLQPLSSAATRSASGDLGELLRKTPPPQVEIIVPKEGEVFAKSTISVLVKTTNAGGSVDEIRMAHNGKSIMQKIDDASKLQQRGRSMTEAYEVALVPGKNVIEASAFNKERIESERARVVVEYKGKEAASNCYILSVGINKYKNAQLNLNFARSDAESFATALKSHSKGMFGKTEVIELYDQQANRAAILEALDKIAAQAGPSDVLYVYYAGHGSMVGDHFYFIPSDNVRLYDNSSIEKDAISDALVQEKLKKIQALKQVVIIDACQSGGGVQTIALRGADNEKALAQLSRSAGVHVMASAGSEQFASEFKELGHGLFTYTLLEALNGQADGAPRDGSISVFELKSYLDAKVPVYSEKHKGKPQYPFTFSIGQDFPVLMREED